MIFADEPTGALDARTGKDILVLLREAVDNPDQTVVMVTHDPVAADFTGSALPPVPLWLYGSLVAFYALLGLAATVVPTRVALQTDPVNAMAARE